VPKRPDPPTILSSSPNVASSKFEYKDEPEAASFVESDDKINDVPTAEFDFLNLNEKPAEKMQEPAQKVIPPKVKEPSFDLLGGFDSNFSDPYPDLVGSALNKPTGPIIVSSSSNSNLDDIFGSLPQSSAPTMAPSKSSSDLNGLNINFGSATTIPSQEKSNSNAKKDPFADLTSNLHADFNAKPSSSSSASQNPFFQPQQSASTSTSPRNNPSTPIHQMKSPSEQQRPDYSRSHFQDPQQQQQSNQQQQKGKPADIFGDILGQQGYSFGKTPQGPRSINEMRKVEMAQTMDPEKLKVAEWVIIKMNNF
jgi:cyclin G-associated kinase